MERLQKYLARCGVSSRRKAETIISEGRVKVNGMTITEQGTKITGKEQITVDGKAIVPDEFVYLVMNKPRGVISSVSDDKGRPTVVSLLPERLSRYRIFPIGRLDYDTKGVLLLTNDGNFMNRLVGPRSDLEKEYLVRVEGIIDGEELQRLRNGLILEDGITRKCKAFTESVDKKNNSSLVRLIIKEGRNHQVKRMLEAIGHPVKRMTRIRFGDITAEGLGEGEVRRLKPHEIKKLSATSRETKTIKK